MLLPVSCVTGPGKPRPLHTDDRRLPPPSCAIQTAKQLHLSAQWRLFLYWRAWRSPTPHPHPRPDAHVGALLLPRAACASRIQLGPARLAGWLSGRLAVMALPSPGAEAAAKAWAGAGERPAAAAGSSTCRARRGARQMAPGACRLVRVGVGRPALPCLYLHWPSASPWPMPWPSAATPCQPGGAAVLPCGAEALGPPYRRSSAHGVRAGEAVLSLRLAMGWRARPVACPRGVGGQWFAPVACMALCVCGQLLPPGGPGIGLQVDARGGWPRWLAWPGAKRNAQPRPPLAQPGRMCSTAG